MVHEDTGEHQSAVNQGSPLSEQPPAQAPPGAPLRAASIYNPVTGESNGGLVEREARIVADYLQQHSLGRSGPNFILAGNPTSLDGLVGHLTRELHLTSDRSFVADWVRDASPHAAAPRYRRHQPPGFDLTYTHQRTLPGGTQLHRGGPQPQSTGSGEQTCETELDPSGEERHSCEITVAEGILTLSPRSSPNAQALHWHVTWQIQAEHNRQTGVLIRSESSVHIQGEAAFLRNALQVQGFIDAAVGVEATSVTVDLQPTSGLSAGLEATYSLPGTRGIRIGFRAEGSVSNPTSSDRTIEGEVGVVFQFR